MGIKSKTKQEIENAVKTSFSLAEVKRKLDLKGGGSQSTLKKYIEKYEIDTSHFTGQRWWEGKTSDETAQIPLEEILKPDIDYRSNTLKHRLIKTGQKEWKCEICGITEWQEQPITLELHHMNGNHYDNRLENLQILCPNCHSQAPGHRNKGKTNKSAAEKLKKNISKKICPICGKEFQPDRESRIFCSMECYMNSLQSKTNKDGTTMILGISKETILEHFDNFDTMTAFSEHLNISRPSLRKILDNYGLLEQFKAKFDFRAKPVLQYDMNMNLIKEWPSMIDAETTLGVCEIHKVCKYARKSAGGYIWRYKNEELQCH